VKMAKIFTPSGGGESKKQPILRIFLHKNSDSAMMMSIFHLNVFLIDRFRILLSKFHLVRFIIQTSPKMMNGFVIFVKLPLPEF